jgi:hypothetical protein
MAVYRHDLGHFSGLVSRRTVGGDLDRKDAMNTMELKYIGACSLLARVYAKLPEYDDESRESIQLALADFQEELPGRFDIHPNGNGIWFEPKRMVTP